MTSIARPKCGFLVLGLFIFKSIFFIIIILDELDNTVQLLVLIWI